jgi:hypothetical protein
MAKILPLLTDSGCHGGDPADSLYGVHLTSITRPTPYGGPDARPLTAAEQALTDQRAHWQHEEGGYAHIQGTKPQSCFTRSVIADLRSHLHGQNTTARCMSEQEGMGTCHPQEARTPIQACFCHLKEQGNVSCNASSSRW